ncbi:hypothetical protein SFB99_17580 [Bacillus altitudinis]|uniref:hypothetical protein n=1 Tax=Bacillus altitudinis TaxID=293387 RepID=UPI000705B15F|nr:hypothetical protein [Bacillus altitudinis]ALM29137.1 hypothetical protein AKO65_14315 [Bacillus altitudinis]ALM45675.1 hypothetical protein AMR71_10630 [Bacillus altitudinis]ANY97155.1 hypothetical protein AKO66_10635 [Bacillus altitudinis]
MTKLEKQFKDWVNHSKEGHRRNDLSKTDTFWKMFLRDLLEWGNGEDIDKIEFSKHVLYTGKLRRIHKDHKDVETDNHYVSWTVAENLKDIYWFDDMEPYTIITAEATLANPGISIKGFIDYMKKYENESYEINSPAIRKEQEVIFPLKENLILTVEKMN